MSNFSAEKLVGIKPTRLILVSWQNRIPCVIQILRNFFSALKNSPSLQRVGCLTLRGEFFEEKKLTKLWALYELLYTCSSINFPKIGDQMLEKLETELKIRGFSKKTVDAYMYHNKNFCNFTNKIPNSVDENDAKDRKSTR